MTTPNGEARPSRPTTRRGFEIAIICALTLEADAVDALFDVHWDDDGSPYDKAEGDTNAYSTGAIGRHHVVLAHMSGMGNANAAAVAANCRASFPNIKLALVVGVCGVVPFSPTGEEIVLSDVIIGDGVIQYDLGRRLPDRFVRKDTLLDSLGRPNVEIRGVLAKLKGIRLRKQLISNMNNYMDVLRTEPLLQAEYPGTDNDMLFEAAYRHTEDRQSCERLGCNGGLVPRSRLGAGQADPQPSVHFGLIASGNSVMKSGEDRDAIAKAEGVIAFEMEGTGVWDSIPCVVIKSACDYANSHKNKVWQRYAAATAAACAKAFLRHWVPSSSAHAVAEKSDREGRQSVHHIPFPKNRHFVERTDIIEKLRRMLFEESKDQQVALVGLGELVKKLNLRCARDEDAKESVQRYLSSEDAGSWFLVLDNVDDVEILDGTSQQQGIYHFLPEHDNGRVLVTTRSQEVAVGVAGRAVVRLHEMSSEEATSFLEKSLIRKDQLQDTKSMVRLLEMLTYLPLAIAQASAYININDITIRDYIRLFQKTDGDIVKLLGTKVRDRTHYDVSQGAVATTWMISFDQIRQKGDEAATLLSFIACIEPKAIPRSLLPCARAEQQLTSAVGTLCGYGFLSRRKGNEVLDMHSLVHLTTQVWIEGQGVAETIRKSVASHLMEIFPSDDWENRELWRKYLPHTLRILGASGGVGVEDCQLGYWAGRCLYADGRMQEAVKLLEHVVAIEEEALAEDHPDRLASQHALAGAYEANGQIKEAVKLLERVVAIREEALAEDHPDRLASQHALAGAYEANGQIKEAVKLLERVVAIREEALAEDHPDRLASQHGLARAYQANGQVEEAIGLLEYVVQIKARTFSESHPSRLVSEDLLRYFWIFNNTYNCAFALVFKAFLAVVNWLQFASLD
ncbi:hypothetical protein B0T10DRAFT_592798 [Thelonectria olida]|uniref:Nucleoside phosphorylase domain-containing protein n=1 Tax=Thelonectria olida TaxID=1576542 RepID=A0A9P9AER2_9HYPO|nr:hypothetical protein B0T10DRAFT_592798 [Thelonectria olida]